MIKTRQMTYLVLASALFLLSSCGSLSISQKRYSNGLNISWFNSGDGEANPRKALKPKRRTNAGNTPVISAETSNTSAQETETQVQYPSNSNPETRETNQVGDVQTTTQTSKPNLSKAEKREIRKTLTQMSVKTNKQTGSISQSPTKVDATHESAGLRAIGWILIILGLIFLLIVSILVGVLFLLVGLLFVIAGK